ncbi:MAG: hypothetical protein M0P73_18660 [Syntrophobacterales bacterium]|jgi:hypothetical protein|nr:hypothetical protein [Syntrophobacterales bacterium]
MLKKCLVSLVIVGFLGSAAFAAKEFPYDKEQIGELHLGLAAKAVQQTISGKPVLGPDELMGADGLHHQEWKYSQAGISLDMTSEKKGGTKSIASISVASPSKLKTQRGIGIGSTAAQVAKAYGPFRNNEDSTPECFVAGSNFGGVIFTFKQGKVSSIFIGAAAE